MGLPERERAELDKTMKELNMSKEEVDKFTKAFKDPEFLKIFEEYAKEVSDPKHKEEMDQYLRQLESGQQVEQVYGKDVELVVPEASFVIKTHSPSSNMKAFINICTSNKVETFKLTKAKRPDGREGNQIDIPMVLGIPRDGTDKSGAKCMVWDLTVHPDTATMALRAPNVRTALADSAMDKIEHTAGQGFKLERDYKMPKLKFKTTQGCDKPPVQTIRKGATGLSSKLGDRIRPSGTPMDPSMPATAQPKPMGSSASADSAPAEPGSGKRSTFSFPAPKQKGGDLLQERKQKEMGPGDPGFKHPGGEVTPKWELVHRGELDLAAAWGDAGRNLPMNTTHPKELVVRVQLPGMTSAAGVDLDVGRSRITLSVPAKFLLDVPLPYSVDDGRAKAKFDKVKQQLEVTLPVLPPPLPSVPPLVQAMPAQAAETADADAAASADALGGSDDVDDTPSEGPGASSSAREEESEEGPAGPADDKVSSSSVPKPQHDEQHEQEELTENQRRWMELHAQQQQQQLQEQQQAAAASASTQGPENTAETAAEQGPSSSALKAAAALAGAGVMPHGNAATAAAAVSQKQKEEQQQVKLKPRLSKALVAELD